MANRLGVVVAMVACLAVPAVPGRAASTPAPRGPATTAASASTRAAAVKPQAFKVYELLPMTCAQAWAAAGRDYSEVYRMVAALATLSLANRELTFPNTKAAGMDAGKAIAADCSADPDALLFALVDKQVRRLSKPAAK